VRTWRCGAAILAWLPFFAALFAQEMVDYTTWGVESERHHWVHMRDLQHPTKLGMWRLKASYGMHVIGMLEIRGYLMDGAGSEMSHT
jgi:hypothetical protein